MRRRFVLGREKTARAFKKFAFAARAAKIIFLAAKLGAMLGAALFDIHPAIRVLHHLCGFPSSAGMRLLVAVKILMHRLAPESYARQATGAAAEEVGLA